MASYKVYKPPEKFPNIYSSGDLQPPKYIPNYYEYLRSLGQQKSIYQPAIATVGAVTFYTVPDGYTYFITSAQIQLYQVTATTFGVLVYGIPPLTNYTAILRMASDVISDSKSEVMTFDIPLRVQEKEVIGFVLGTNTGYYGAVIHGFLVSNRSILY